MNAHRLNRIALVTVFGLALALPQAARSQTLVAVAEDIAGDSEVLRLAGDVHRRVTVRAHPPLLQDPFMTTSGAA